MIGTTLGHYEIRERLGAGGMGVVYRARDLKLGRDVALKLLPDDVARDPVRVERLTREARAVAGLSHPNIVTLHSIEESDGRPFLTMELVEGDGLDALIGPGGMPAERTVALAVPIAEALAAAHRVGIVHRDLKPSNVVVTRDGRPKVLDFGLARRLDPSSPDAESHGDTATLLTQEGVAIGTLPYMSPEQVQGRAVDARSDVYALGALLFEMATGQRPLDGASPAELVSAILRDAPPAVSAVRPGAPTGLDRIVARCLEKDPARRYASAREALADLVVLRDALATGGSGGRALTAEIAAAAAHAPDAIRSIAVLPLENVSRDPAQEYFADGMTEALISDLARLKALRVISRTSAMKYKGAAQSIPDIARELNVDAILEGSALLVGTRVRISVQLVSARADETLWAERYDRQLEDVLDLQSEVARAIAKEIALQVTPPEAVRLARRQPVNPAAHLEYLKGRHENAITSPSAVDAALGHFRRALDIDPSLAPAWAAIAWSHNIRSTRGMAPPTEASAQGLAAAEKALALDPSLAEGHAVIGAILSRHGDLPRAIRSLRRAIELNPGLAQPYYELGRVLYCTERHAEAQEAMLRALDLDPLSMLIHTSVGDAYYYARRYEESVTYYRRAVEIDPRFDGAHTDLARSLEALGQFDEARAQYEEGRRLGGSVAGALFGLAHLAARVGQVDEARQMLHELIARRANHVVSAWGIAVLHASLGDLDGAFRWLETAVAEQASGLVFLRVHPRLDPIRHDPRYHELVHRLGLDAPPA